MNYILIQNDGEIETNSFELIGASTKRGEAGKIGFFGSGLKYSIAYMMRKGISFKIFSGLNEVKFSTTPETLKDKTFERICINDKPTSFTVTMGPTWTEDWFVLREIYCNALDETGCQLIKNTENVSASEGKTRIYIEVTAQLKEVCNNWDAYFSEDRTPDFISEEVYTAYFGSGDGANFQQVSVYSKTSGVYYRRGIRVFEQKNMMFDYGFPSCDINEDRTARNSSAFSYGIFSLFSCFANEGYVRDILRQGSKNESPSYEYGALTSSTSSCAWSEKWVKFSKDYLLVTRYNSGKYQKQISESHKEVFLLPNNFARELKKNIPDVSILGMGKISGNFSFSETEITPKMEYLLKEVQDSLVQMNYKIQFPIQIVEFDDHKIMGRADIENEIIMIGDTTFDKGKREIALTLMEENEHIISGYRDETREFETHIFSTWLKTMEENSALFL